MLDTRCSTPKFIARAQNSESGERRLLAYSRRQLADDTFQCSNTKRGELLQSTFRQAAEKNRLGSLCSPEREFRVRTLK